MGVLRQCPLLTNVIELLKGRKWVVSSPAASEVVFCQSAFGEYPEKADIHPIIDLGRKRRSPTVTSCILLGTLCFLTVLDAALFN